MANEQQTSRLRPSHIIASSLAALTGAFLASRLGVYGTVIGVGVKLRRLTDTTMGWLCEVVPSVALGCARAAVQRAVMQQG